MVDKNKIYYEFMENKLSVIYTMWLDKVKYKLKSKTFNPKKIVQLEKTITDGLKVLHLMLRLEMNKRIANVDVQQSRKDKDSLTMVDKNEMYHEFMENKLSIPKLAAKHVVPLDTAKNWIYGPGGWKEKRDLLEQEQVHNAVVQGSKELASAWQAGAEIYMKWLDKVNYGLESGAFSAKELVQLGKTIPDGLKVLHPMLRLEMNKSTANVDVQQSRKDKDSLTIEVPDDVFNMECDEGDDDR
jgi:hypothetical protein